MQRDREVNAELENKGYTVFRFWEAEVKKEFDKSIAEVVSHLKNVDNE